MIMSQLSTSMIKSWDVVGSSTTSEDLGNVCRLLDADLRPLTPDDTCKLSREIFEEHKQIAEEYLKVQTEIALLSQHKNEMLKNLSLDSLQQQQELRKLEDEKVFPFYCSLYKFTLQRWSQWTRVLIDNDVTLKKNSQV